MPQELHDPERFLNLSLNALNCRVKRLEDKVKLKVKTKKRLYTYITDPQTAEALLSRIQCDIIEM